MLHRVEGTTGGGDPILEVRGLRKLYPNGTLALDDVSLSARRGELTAVLGANGSGKSTLVRCIVRLISPTAGEVLVDGLDCARLQGRDLRRVRQRVAVVFQSSSLVRRRSALANVAIGSLARDRGPLTMVGLFPPAEMERAGQSLARVGLTAIAGQRVDTLSGGQAQRVAIARALLQDATLIIADEPVASLDPEATEDVMSLLRSLAHDDGLAVVCVLHQVQIARRYADRMIGMRDGRVVLDRPPEELDETALADLYRTAA
jgi:phosphonate transport system ATP-binding protein